MVTLQSKFIASPTESGLHHETYFGQWDISKHDTGRDFKRTCPFTALGLEPFDHHVNEPMGVY